MQQIRVQVLQIITTELECEEEEMAEDVVLDEILMDTWDWATLRDALEESFHLEIPDQILGVRVESPFDSTDCVEGRGEVRTVGDLIRYIEEKCRRWLA